MKACKSARSTTRNRRKELLTFTVAASTVALLGVLSAPQAMAYTVTHDFTSADVQGDWNGATAGQVPVLICTSCPPMIDKKTGDTLYPVESVFGFEVVDFVGAAGKVIDWDWAEGWAGDFVDADTVRHTAALIARLRVSPEGQEGLTAFLEKRKARWQT